MNIGGPRVVFFSIKYDTGSDSVKRLSSTGTSTPVETLSLYSDANHHVGWQKQKPGEHICYALEVWAPTKEEAIDEIVRLRDQYPDMYCTYHISSHWKLLQYEDGDCWSLKFSLGLTSDRTEFIGPLPSLRFCLSQPPKLTEDMAIYLPA